MKFNRFMHALRPLLAALMLPLVCAAAQVDAKAYVGNFKDNTVSVINTVSQSVIGVIAVAAGPHGMVLSPDGDKLWISGDASSQVSVIDTASDRVVRTLDVGQSPHGLALSTNGRQLLVAINGEDRLAVFDTATGQPTGSIRVAKPHTIAVQPGGNRAYVASQAPGHFALVVIDLATLTVQRELPLEKPPRDLEFAFDGRALYFTVAGENAVMVLDPRSEKIVARIPTGASPHIASLFRGAASGTVVVQGPGELTLFDPLSNVVLRSIAVGRQPHWAATGDGGRTVWVTDEGSNEVSIVEMASGNTRSLPVGNAPRKIVVQQRATAPVADSGPSLVSIANFAFQPQEVSIDVGQTVVWANDDGAPHGLVYQDGTQGVDLLLPGRRFARRFDQVGIVEYACRVHPYMTGKVVIRSR